MSFLVRAPSSSLFFISVDELAVFCFCFAYRQAVQQNISQVDVPVYVGVTICGMNSPVVDGCFDCLGLERIRRTLFKSQ
jgi:hypothetical protein